MEGGKPLTAKEKRHEQMKRWENSATDLECATYTNPKIRVKFDDGAVFLAACSAGDLDEVKALLDGGADINFANVDGLTALHQACIDGNLEVVQFLVEQGSNIDQEDNEGWTPLHATASCGFMDIAKYLVEKGAKVGAINSEAELPIDIAEEEDMIDYLQSVIDKQGIDVEEARNIERLIMLEDAKELLEKYQNGEKIDSFSHPKSGATPLHITAAKGYNDVMKILIKVGLDVNAMDNDGWTPLHAASHWSQEESAKILADKNANFKARSKLGQTCFDVADEDMLEYLEELETAQDNDKAIEEPPPEKLPARSPPSATRESLVSEEINDVQNGEKKSLLKDTKVSDPVAPEDEFRLTRRPGSFRSAFTSESKSKETEKSAVENADIDTSDRLQRRNRPASLQISSSNEQTHRPLTSTISEGGSKPVAATQPVQSVTRGIRENGRTSSYTRDKDDPLSSWKTGVRRPTNFDDKPISRSDTEKSSYSSRFSDEAKTARVAPIVDSRRAKESEHDTPSMNDVASGSSRTSSSYSRKKSASDAATNSTVTDLISDPPSSFKRSVSYKKAIGRVESLENNDDMNELLSRRPKTISNLSKEDSRIVSLALSGVERDGVIGHFEQSIAGRSSSLSPSFSRQGKLSQDDNNVQRCRPKKPLFRRWSIDKELHNIKPVTGHASLVFGSNLLRSFQPIPKTNEKSSIASNLADSSQQGSSFQRLRLRSNSADVLVKPVVAVHTKFHPSDQHESTENSSSSKLSEAPNEKATENSANDDIESQKLADAEKRRYHLQPVADEEAEARRKIRSRRERQTRRSTQGVTLDVYEEAMRTIGQMKKQTSTDKTDSSSSDTAKSRNDTSSSLTKRDESQSSVNAGAGTPVASLPSGYIPSNQRVKSNESSDGKNANLTVPSISVEATASDDDKGDASTSENNSSTAANRKLTAQQRRRNRSQRRSTGLPDLKPSISATTEPEGAKQSVSRQFDEKVSLTSKEKADNATPKCSPFSSPAKKHYLTPERDLDWLRNLKKVTRGRTAVQSGAKLNSGRRFNNKDEFKRKSIECDLHPTALALKKGINPRDLSPVRASGIKKPYGGYFTKNTPTPDSGLNKARRSVSSVASNAGPSGNIPTPRRRLSYDLSSPLVNPFKKLKAPSCDRPGSTPPITDKMLSVKKPGSVIKQIKGHFRLDNPLTKFSDKKKDVDQRNEPFQFKGATAPNSSTATMSSKQLSKGDRGFKHSMSKCRRKVKEALWPPVGKLHTQNRQMEEKLQSGDGHGKACIGKSESELVKEEQGSGDYMVDVKNPEQEEEETTTKDDYLEPSKAERLRQKYDTSSLPGRLDRHRGNVKPSESDIPSRISQPGDDTSSYSPRSRNPDTQNYKKLYEDNVEENERLRTELADAQRKISELQTRLEKAEVNATQKQALENEKRERRVLEQKISEMEKELQKSDGVEELRKTNGHLKAENNALQRIVEKLGGTVPNNVQQILDENKSTVRISSASSIATLGRKFRSESNPDLVKLNSGASDSLPDQDIASLASPNPLSRSSSSSSLSIEEEKNTDTRRGSLASSDYGSRTARLRDEAGSSSSAGSYSMRKDKSVPSSSYSSSPSLTTRSGSPRRPLASNYGNTYESLRSSNFPRYSGMNKDSTSTYSSTSYNSLPRSSTRRDYSKSSATPSTGSSSTSYLRTGSGYRTTPTPYSTTGSKSSYSANSRSKTGYTSSTSSHSGTSSPSKYSLSKYSTNLSSSRRNAKF